MGNCSGCGFGEEKHSFTIDDLMESKSCNLREDRHVQHDKSRSEENGKSQSSQDQMNQKKRKLFSKITFI